jgi:hypothetical protein
MRMCPKCRLITGDGSVCAECGWNLGGDQPSPNLASTYAQHLRQLVLFTASMFVAGFLVAFSVTHGSAIAPLAGGLFAAGFIGDLFLLRLIYRAAGIHKESQRWMVGAILTFPFGTLVFAWVLARRLALGKEVPPAGRIP